jgi:endonuclease/exonuclease/phosphatase family metal-dependent hydrolase
MRTISGYLSIAALLIFIVVEANTPVPGIAVYGEYINAPASWVQAVPDRIVVASYNIRRSKGEDNERDISRAAGVLRDADADIVGLNELSGTLFYGLADQAEQIGGILQAGWLFAPAYELFYQPHFGNGLVSRFLVSSWQIHPLFAEEDSSFRNMIIATIPIADTTLTTLTTHLDRSAVRDRQLGQVLARFASLPSPAVLMGDLNTRVDDPRLSAFLENPAYTDAIFTALGQPHDVEWIISKGLNVKSGGSEPPGVSDHPAYWVEFSIDR